MYTERRRITITALLIMKAAGASLPESSRHTEALCKTSKRGSLITGYENEATKTIDQQIRTTEQEQQKSQQQK
jgi:hypothetical protein